MTMPEPEDPTETDTRRHPGVDDPTLWQEGQVLGVSAPMTQKLRELGGRYVVLHIIGGMQVDGSVTELDIEDGTVTLEEKGRKTIVALHAIAVLQPGNGR